MFHWCCHVTHNPASIISLLCLWCCCYAKHNLILNKCNSNIEVLPLQWFTTHWGFRRKFSNLNTQFHKKNFEFGQKTSIFGKKKPFFWKSSNLTKKHQIWQKKFFFENLQIWRKNIKFGQKTSILAKNIPSLRCYLFSGSQHTEVSDESSPT